MEQFREMVRRLPVGVEFLIVVILAFGQFIVGSILAIGAPETSTYTNQALLSLLIAELMQFAFLAWFLHLRGWTLEKFGLHVTVRTTGGGLLLAIATLGIFFFVQVLASQGIDMESAERLYPKVSPKLDLAGRLPGVRGQRRLRGSCSSRATSSRCSRARAASGPP